MGWKELVVCVSTYLSGMERINGVCVRYLSGMERINGVCVQIPKWDGKD